MAPQTQTPGIARACAECHKRKIRCDVGQENGQSCSNCRLYGTACQLRARKRRKTNHDATALNSVEPSSDHVSETLRPPPSKRRSEVHRATKVDEPSASSSPATSGVDETSGDIIPTESQAPNGVAYLDYTDYYGQHTYLKGKSDGKLKSRQVALSETDKEILRLQSAFDLPPESLKASLIESFMKYCFPWVPIFDQQWLWDGKETGSPALTKAVLVAGARTSDTAMSCQEYYSAAKYLLLCGHETNPILTIVACLLLGWWNQTSPDIVSLDNSTSWIRQAVGVAYQIDLHKEPRRSHGASYRRRLWWTLVARDSQLSASHGRPRYINLAICHVRPLCLEDLTDNSRDSQVFVAYVKASILLGDIAEFCQQGNVTPARFAELRNALLWWLKELPVSIRYFEPGDGSNATEENFNIRQVYMLYLCAAAILHRSIRSGKTPSAVELIASSFIVSLFEDFYSRNELRRLSAGFNFYPIVAAIPQLEALQFSSLQDCIHSEMEVIENSLQDLAKRWPSANRGLKLLEKVRQTSSNTARSSNTPQPALPRNSDLLLFENFNYARCRIWRPLTEPQDMMDTPKAAAASASQEDRNITHIAVPFSVMNEALQPTPSLDFDPSTTLAYDDLGFWLADPSFDSDLFGGWMLNDDAFGNNLNL